jgi:hypothetical protein
MGATINTRLHSEINQISRVKFARIRVPNRNQPRRTYYGSRQNYTKIRLLKSKRRQPDMIVSRRYDLVLSYLFLFAPAHDFRREPPLL